MDAMLTMAKMRQHPMPVDHREEVSSGDNWWTAEDQARADAYRSNLMKPKYEPLFTVFGSQSGALLFVKHSDDPIRLGIDQALGIVPPMVIATTDEHWEWVGESCLYQGMRHVNGSSRAGRIIAAAQRDLARIPRNRQAVKTNTVKENEAA